MFYMHLPVQEVLKGLVSVCWGECYPECAQSVPSSGHCQAGSCAAPLMWLPYVLLSRYFIVEDSHADLFTVRAALLALACVGRCKQKFIVLLWFLPFSGALCLIFFFFRDNQDIALVNPLASPGLDTWTTIVSDWDFSRDFWKYILELFLQ